MMEENQPTEQISETTNIPQKKTKNIGVVVSLFVVLLIASAVIVARLYSQIRQKEQTTANAIAPVANVMYQNKISPTPTLDTSDAQLDKDLQNAQNSLDTLDTDITNSTQ